MAVSKPTFRIIHDTRTKNKDSKYSIKLRVTFERVSRLYSLNLFTTVEDFQKLHSSKLRDQNLKDIKFECENARIKAEALAKSMDSFNFEDFKAFMFPSPEEQMDKSLIETLFQEKIKQLKKDGRVSTYQSYQSAYNSISEFNKKLKWENITVKFLNDYEKRMKNNGKSVSTVGIYLRPLRAMYNVALEKGIVARENYPFSKKKYVIPKSKNIKKALTLKEIELIFNYPTVKMSSQDRAKDLWIFSYLCNGLNIKDICRLKFKNLVDDKLTLIRAKTELTSKGNQKEISIILHKKAKNIVNKWSNEISMPNSYIFPFLTQEMDAHQERSAVQNITQQINKYMKRIGKDLGIEKPLTTYVARHSFSTVLKRSGAPIAFISESLGHQNLQTTESYLDSFEDEVKVKYSNLLTDF